MYRHRYIEEQIAKEGIKKAIFKFIIGLFVSFVTMTLVYSVEKLTIFLDSNKKELITLLALFPILFTFAINKVRTSFMNFFMSIYVIVAGFFFVYPLHKYGFNLILIAVGASSIIFSIMCLYANKTSEDLERERVLLKISLFFLIGTYLINMYFGVYILHWILAYWALITFTGLIGYDFQHFKKELTEASINDDLFERVSLTGTLHFYMNFMIMTLVLLNIFGKILN